MIYDETTGVIFFVLKRGEFDDSFIFVKLYITKDKRVAPKAVKIKR